MSVRINLEIGHEASLRTKRTQEGFTHDWEVFVKGCDGADIQHYVEKVVFYLHETFTKPRRVVKEPPYSIKESGYAGFVLIIDIYLRNKDEPKKIKFNYDLNLQTSGPAIHRTQKEKYIFKDLNDEFKQRLLKGGGQIASSSSSNESENKFNTDKTQLLNKPKLGGSIDHKKPKKMEEPRETTFKDLFGPPIKCTKPPEPKASSGGGAIKDLIKKDKDKVSDKERKNKSPMKDRDKEKRDKEERKKDKSKERNKEHERSSEKKDKKRDKSPSRSLSPGMRARANSPKRMSSPKRPPSPLDTKSKDDKKDEKEKRKDKDKEREKDDKKYKKRDKDKEKDYKDHKETKKDLKLPSMSMSSIKDKEASASPLPPPTIKLDKDKKEKPKEKEIKADAKPEDVDKSKEDKKEKHKHKKKDKDRDKDKDKDKEKRDKSDKHKSKDKEKKFDSPASLFSTNQPPLQPPIQPQLEVPTLGKLDKKKFALDVENDNSNSSCNSSTTKESEVYKPPSPMVAPIVPPAPPPAPEPRLEAPLSKPKKDKTKKKDKKLEKEEKRRRRRDLSPGEDEPSIKTSKDESDATPPVIDVDARAEIQENPEDYLRILQELQHKIMSLQDNTELQKVVKLIAETGRYEVSARTFDFDLCLLERSTVRRLQEFFSVTS